MPESKQERLPSSCILGIGNHVDDATVHNDWLAENANIPQSSLLGSWYNQLEAFIRRKETQPNFTFLKLSGFYIILVFWSILVTFCLFDTAQLHEGRTLFFLQHSQSFLLQTSLTCFCFIFSAWFYIFIVSGGNTLLFIHRKSQISGSTWLWKSWALLTWLKPLAWGRTVLNFPMAALLGTTICNSKQEYWGHGG